MLQERDHGGRHAHDLLGADVHVVDVLGRLHAELVAVADHDALLGEVLPIIERRVGLRDVVALLLVGGEVLDLAGDHRARARRPPCAP